MSGYFIMIKSQLSSFSRIYGLFLLLTLWGCDQEKESNAQVNHDLVGLGKLLDLDWVKPDSVSYVIQEVVPQKNSRLSAPGPVDNRIEVVMFFGEEELEKLRAASADSPASPYTDRKALVFSWLPEGLRQELKNTVQLNMVEDQWFAPARSGVYVILNSAVVLVSESR